MLEQPKAGLISRFFRQVENRLKKDLCFIFKYTEELIEIIIAAILKSDFEIKIQMSWPDNKNSSSIHS